MLKNRFFRVCLLICLCMALFTGVFAIFGWGSFLPRVGGTILYPFQWAASTVGRAVSGFVSHFEDTDRLMSEMESLRSENESLRAQLTDAQLMSDEHSWLYAYLSMKEEHDDYSMVSATVITSASSDSDGGAYAVELTLNKGSSSGIETGMPVVTVEGLVGIVTETGANWCRVRTVLHTDASIGAITSRTGETGLCEGDFSTLHAGCSVLRYMKAEADVAVGDIILTSGKGSVYPYGIPIGVVTGVAPNAYSRTMEAEVRPFADMTGLKQVIILTSYDRSVGKAEKSAGDLQ